MLQNAVIDIAIGLMLMYLVLSLLCTMINEYISTVLKWRAKDLQKSLTNLLDNDALRQQFYKHGLIDGAQGASGGQHSSYFDGKTVALALIGALDTSKPIPAIGDIQGAVAKLPADSNIKSVLQATLAEANGDLDKLRTSIAGWYDNAMDRLSGAYKRKLKLVALIVGLVTAAALNADSLRVGKALWLDPALRTQIVGVADDYLKACGNDCLKPDANLQSLTTVQEKIKSSQETLRPLPVGWPETPEGLWWYIQKIAGLLVTGVALSLGAPFWFDLLSKFMKLRGSGDPPKKTGS